MKIKEICDRAMQPETMTTHMRLTLTLIAIRAALLKLCAAHRFCLERNHAQILQHLQLSVSVVTHPVWQPLAGGRVVVVHM